MNNLPLLFLCGLLLLAGCKKEMAPSTAAVNTETIGRITVKNLDFDYLSAKGQIQLEDKGENLASGVSIRMKKDSVIWISVLPGLGIEAARLMITQDSVHIMNRLRKEYVVTDFDYLSRKLKIDVNFDMLQAMLLGNYQSGEVEKVLDEAQIQHVQQLRENLLFDYFIGRENQKLQQLNVVDQSSENSLVIKYTDFQPVGEIPFAHTLEAQAQQKGQISNFKLNQSKLAVTDEVLTFPFSVPTDYNRLQMN